MKRNILTIAFLTGLAAAFSLYAEPAPSSDSTSNKQTKKAESSRQQLQNSSASKTVSPEGWSYVKGEWIHSDGYKYVNGQIIRIGAQTHKRPPKPPSKSLLDSVKSKVSPTPAPNSAAAKAAEKERNLRPRPAPQTGTHL